MQGQSNFELKGQARRLKTALAEMGIHVSHCAALNLIARVQGARNWEVLEATMRREQSARERALWLRWLEAMLRMQHVSEYDMDDLVHEVLAPSLASTINNQGMSQQLDALLAYEEESACATGQPELARKALIETLRRSLQLSQDSLPVPEVGHEARRRTFIPVRISVCAGSSFEQVVMADALEWVVAQPVVVIQQLVETGLDNNDATDQVALWLKQHSRWPQTRQAIAALLQHCQEAQKQDPELVGLTVRVSGSKIRDFLRLMPLTK